MKKLSLAILLLATTVAFVSCGKSGDGRMMEEKEIVLSGEGLNIQNPWAKEVPEVQPQSAAFLEIHNAGDADDVLLSAESDVSEVTELHTMIYEGDMMKMRKVEKIDVPAGKVTQLKPGGLHIMLIKLTKPLVAGDTVNLTLNFEKKGEVKLSIPVKKHEMKMMHDHH